MTLKTVEDISAIIDRAYDQYFRTATDQTQQPEAGGRFVARKIRGHYHV